MFTIFPFSISVLMCCAVIKDLAIALAIGVHTLQRVHHLNLFKASNEWKQPMTRDFTYDACHRWLSSYNQSSVSNLIPPGDFITRSKAEDVPFF